MSSRPAPLAFIPNAETHYAIRAADQPYRRGGEIRTARKNHGFTASETARILQMPVTNLILVEQGAAEFVQEGDQRRVIDAIESAGKRKASLK